MHLLQHRFVGSLPKTAGLFEFIICFRRLAYRFVESAKPEMYALVGRRELFGGLQFAQSIVIPPCIHVQKTEIKMRQLVLRVNADCFLEEWLRDFGMA